MVRFVLLALSGAALALATLPAAAETAPPRHSRKAARPSRPVPAATAPGHNINTPSTDFSKVEIPGENTSEDGNHLRPVMGAGGMGVGGAF